MLGSVQHIQSVTIGDFTGTVTVFNSAGSTVTANATDIVRPSNWNSLHQFNLTISGNTQGSSTIGGATNVVLAGGSNVTLSMNTAASAATVSINAAGGVLSRFTDWGANFGSISSQSIIANSLVSIRAFTLGEPLNFSRVDVLGTVSIATATHANTFAMAISSTMVIYTRTGSTLSPLVGVTSQTTFSVASSTANYASVTGPRLLSFGLATQLTPGEYFAGVQISSNTSSVGTATTSYNATLGVAFFSTMSATEFREFGSTQVASTNIVFGGVWSTGLTATGQTIAMSDMSQTGTGGLRANIPLIFRNW